MLTFFPRFFQVPGPEGPSEPYWVIAAGAGTIFFPPQLHDDYPNGLPDLDYRTYFERSMVRVFVAQDPTPLFTGDTTVAAQLDAYTLIGPSPSSAAYRIQPFEWLGRHYLVVTDLGGAVQLWDLTDLLDPSTPEIIHPDLPAYGNFMLEEWRTPLCVSDDVPNAVWSLDIDLADTVGGPEPDEVHLYVQVGRVGIKVLKFNPSGSPSYLEEIDHIETPSGSGGLRIRRKPTGEVDLLSSDRDSGLRGFRRP